MKNKKQSKTRKVITIIKSRGEPDEVEVQQVPAPAPEQPVTMAEIKSRLPKVTPPMPKLR